MAAGAYRGRAFRLFFRTVLTQTEHGYPLGMQENIIAIGVAFLFGLAARLAGLPPLVGYLVGGVLLAQPELPAALPPEGVVEIVVADAA